MTRCIECRSMAGPLAEVEGGAICHRCVAELLGGAIPERITCGGPRPVYWWWCVCGLQVRCGPYQVNLAVVVATWPGSEKGLTRELERIEDYRALVEGIPSAGVMLCRPCAAVAGSPLPAPAALCAGGTAPHLVPPILFQVVFHGPAGPLPPMKRGIFTLVVPSHDLT